MSKASPKKERPLTAKQTLFCAEYLIDMNGAAAARRAGYSEKTADAIAMELLRKTSVAAEVKRLMEERSARVKMDADALLLRLVQEANADVSDIFDEDGTLKPVWKWPEVWRRGLIAGIEIEKLYEGRGKERVQVGTLTKVKISDRVRRLELIGKHVGVQAFKEKVEHSVADPLADLLAQVQGRTIKPKEG